jgi:hypothetical protein
MSPGEARRARDSLDRAHARHRFEHEMDEIDKPLGERQRTLRKLTEDLKRAETDVSWFTHSLGQGLDR